MNKLLMLAFSVIFLNACSSIETKNEAYAESLDKYVGQDIQLVVDDLGHADQVSEAPNGNRLFVYHDKSNQSWPSDCYYSRYAGRMCSGGEIKERWCKTYFEVDANNKVLEHSFKGNYCRE